MIKAVFLDRDGVINNNSESYYVYRAEDFIINDDILESLRIIKEKNYKIFVISNQGGISKGLYAKTDVNLVHDKLIDILESKDIKIVEIYFCPHHDSIENCFCRKPDSLLIEKLIAMFDIDIDNSYLIGDSERDIIAAEKTGLNTFRIESNTSILSICESLPFA